MTTQSGGGLLARIQQRINEGKKETHINESHVFDMVHRFIISKGLRQILEKGHLDDKFVKKAYEMGTKFSDKQASDTLEDLKRGLIDYAVGVLSGERPVKERIVSLYAKLAGYLKLDDGL